MSHPIPHTILPMVDATKILSDTCSGVVAYYPDHIKIRTLIDQLISQVRCIILYDNGGLESCYHDPDYCKERRIILLGNSQNKGIAFALNEILRHAEQLGIPHVITFDQDSAIQPDFVASLRKYFLNARPTERLAAVGPIFSDQRDGQQLFPIFQPAGFWIRKIYPTENSDDLISTNLLITSGMFLSVSAWREVGPFLDELFIDHVDTEWCLRAISKGYSIAACTKVRMAHELSDDAPKRIFGRLVLKYSPVRRYYAFRNTIRLIFLPHTPIGLKIYLSITLAYRLFINLLVDDSKILSTRAMFKGIWHGLTNQLGKI